MTDSEVASPKYEDVMLWPRLSPVPLSDWKIHLRAVNEGVEESALSLP